MVHMLIYQHSWSEQGQKKLFWSEMRSYQTGREFLGLHQRPEKEEKKEINKRIKGQMEYRLFSLWSAVLTCSRHP